MNTFKKNGRKLILILLLPIISSAQEGLSVHGYLSQAFAITDDHTIFGITDEGTFDYRNLALQFRYDTDESNTFIVQLSHSRIGISPVMRFSDDVELDWAFFQHIFDNGLSLKVGKLQLPFGIYNEIRDVGVLLPFYQVPFTPYGETNYTSETISGLQFSYEWFWGEWALQANLYAGEFSFVEWLIFENPIAGNVNILVEIAKVRNLIGTQLWLTTPYEGFRVGLNGMRGEIGDGVAFSDDLLGESDIQLFLGSLDYSKEDYFIRSEYGFFKTAQGVSAHTIYGHSGFRFAEDFSLNVQASLYHLQDLPLYLGLSRDEVDFFVDYAFGINFFMTNSIVLKAETHWNKGYLVEDESTNFSFPASKTIYSIISLSSSF